MSGLLGGGSGSSSPVKYEAPPTVPQAQPDPAEERRLANLRRRETLLTMKEEEQKNTTLGGK